jgi:putative ABC transport system permease protein
VTPGYFMTMGIPLLAGRTFSEADGPDAPQVAIVSVALAKKYWSGENPVGKRLRFERDPKAPWFTVVGLVGDVRQLGLEKSAPPLLFFPYQQFPIPFTQVAVRSTLPVSAVTSLLRGQLASIDRDLPFGEIVTLDAVVDRSMEQPRFRTLLIGLFALLALVLAAIGVYGLISYTVAQRTREIGIRMALGAHPGQVLGPMMREGLVLAGLGIAIGMAGSLAMARLLSTFLFGIGATDPATFAAAAALLVVVALAASYIPSRRALKVDPLTALRAE